MNTDDAGDLVDERAGRLVRPYLSTEGRTAPAVEMDRLTMVCSTRMRRLSSVEPYHAQVLALCGEPRSIAELAAHMGLPPVSIKVLVSDLIKAGAVQANPPTLCVGEVPLEVLQALYDGLQKRL